jgi:hypothetical protein
MYCLLILTFDCFSWREDINLWDDMAKSPLTHIYFSVFLGGLTVFIACFSVYKLVLFIRYQGFGLTVPVLSLVMIIISCICTRGASSAALVVLSHR